MIHYPGMSMDKYIVFSLSKNYVIGSTMRLMRRRLFFFIFSVLIVSLEALPDGMRYQYFEKEEIHVLEIDPSKVRIAPAHAGKDILALETVSTIAKRHQAAAAINGGFFRTQKPYEGTSAGILRIGGEWYSSPTMNRAAIGWKQSADLQTTEAAIDRIALDMKLFVEGQALPIDGINQPPTMLSAILYTSQFAPMTLTSSAYAELAVEADGSCHEQSGPTSIPKNGFVYSLAPAVAPRMPFLKPDAHARPQFTFHSLIHPDDSGKWPSFPNIVGGAPVLVADGIALSDFSTEHLPDSFINEMHARTAIGIDRQGKWLIVVAKGMKLAALARFMHRIGSIHALNLDGGHSSTLILEGKVVNASKETEETPVSNAILF